MDGQETAGVTRVPRLQNFECCAVAHFAHDDPIRPEAQGHLHEIAHRDLRVRALKVRICHIGAGTFTQFGCVLWDEETRSGEVGAPPATHSGVVLPDPCRRRPRCYVA